jgi:hypothetical protein
VKEDEIGTNIKEMEAVYTNSVEKPEGRGHSRDVHAERLCSIEVDIDIKDTFKLELMLFCCYDMVFVYMILVREQRLAFANAVMNLWAP